MTHIGINSWELRILQPLLLDIQIPIDTRSCNDHISNTIDYHQLCQKVTEYVASNTFGLIETVAEKVAELIKNEFKVSEITISVSKPHAIKNAGNVGVTITRS